MIVTVPVGSAIVVDQALAHAGHVIGGITDRLVEPDRVGVRAADLQIDLRAAEFVQSVLGLADE